MLRPLLAIAMVLAIAACGSSPAAAHGTGVRGIVEVGPTCPVERLNSPCASRPLAATVVFRDSAGREVTRVQAGADGRFTVDLLPGTYSVIGVNPGSAIFPRPIPTSVTVVAGRYTPLIVQYDSGIR